MMKRFFSFGKKYEEISAEPPVTYGIMFDNGYSAEIHYAMEREEWRRMQEFGERVQAAVRRKNKKDVTVNQLHLIVDGGGDTFTANVDSLRDKAEGGAIRELGITRQALLDDAYNSAHADFVIQHELGHIDRCDPELKHALAAVDNQLAMASTAGNAMRRNARHLAESICMLPDRESRKAMRFIVQSYRFRKSLAADREKILNSPLWDLRASSDGIRDFLYENPAQYDFFSDMMKKIYASCEKREAMYKNDILPLCQALNPFNQTRVRAKSKQQPGAVGRLAVQIERFGDYIRTIDDEKNTYRLKNSYATASEYLQDACGLQNAPGDKEAKIDTFLEFLVGTGKTYHWPSDPLRRPSRFGYHPDKDKRISFLERIADKTEQQADKQPDAPVSSGYRQLVSETATEPRRER